jgi:hypothetical protein
MGSVEGHPSQICVEVDFIAFAFFAFLHHPSRALYFDSH